MTSVQSVTGNHMISSKVWDKSARIYLRNEDERPKINFMYRKCHNAGIRKAVRHARMAHKATKWPIIKILTGPVMRPDRTKLVKYKLFCEKDFNL